MTLNRNSKKDYLLAISIEENQIIIYNSSFVPFQSIISNSPANVMNVLLTGYLVVGFRNSSICIYDQNSFGFVKELKHNAEIKGLLILPQTGELVSASIDGNILLWKPISFEKTTIQAIGNNLSQIALINNLEIISVASTNNSFQIFSKPPDSYTNTNNLTGHYDAVLDLAILDNGFLASGSADSTIKLWDNTLKNVANVTSGSSGHVRSVLALNVLKNHNLVSTSEDRTAKIWLTDLYVNIKTFN